MVATPARPEPPSPHSLARVQDLLLGGRQELLDRLRSIYEERSQLNQITMSIMLPRRSLDSDKDCATTEGKIKSAARYGAGCMLSQTAELVTALDRLKANLSSERRMLIQLHASLIRKVRLCPSFACALPSGGACVYAC